MKILQENHYGLSHNSYTSWIWVLSCTIFNDSSSIALTTFYKKEFFFKENNSVELKL
jgi:hypothetical protein